MHNSLVRQSLHYFARPHERVRLQPLASPAAWLTSDLAAGSVDGDWRYELSQDEKDELTRAVDSVRGRPLGELTRRDFALPTLAGKLAEWRDTISGGRGFIVLGGVPIDVWSEQDAERCFWCLGQHLGIPGAQNPQGDLLGHVRDETRGVDDVTIRAYRTRSEIAFHCDAADAVGLLCLHGAKQGGGSRIASSVSVFNTLVAEDPQLASRLFEPIVFDTKNQGGVTHVPMTPCRYADGALRTFYHSDYYRTARRHPGVPPLSDIEARLLDRYDAIANDDEHCLEMVFEPGDIQLLSNHTIIHGRAAYTDDEDLDRRRHLLRLWLSFPTQQSARFRWMKLKSTVGVAASLAYQQVSQRLRQP